MQQNRLDRVRREPDVLARPLESGPGHRDMATFSERCTLCGTCRRACPFLEKFGLPGEIVLRASDDVFLCTNCGACDSLCPQFLFPSAVLMSLKAEKIRSGLLSHRLRAMTERSRRFAETGHRFPFRHYPVTETAFWPGCSLAGQSPALVLKTAQILAGHLKEDVGVALDCCFDPLYQQGDLDAAGDAATRISGRLRTHGIRRLIVGCGNCGKVFRSVSAGVIVEHVVEVLPAVSPSSGMKGIFLHHPCPSFRDDTSAAAASAYLAPAVVQQTRRPLCCGLGGGVYDLAPEMADAFLQQAMQEANGLPLVTYCMGCRERFLQGGAAASHLLEHATGMQIPQSVLSGRRKWWNRLLLSARLSLATTNEMIRSV